MPSGGVDPGAPQIDLKVEIFGIVVFDDNFDATTVGGTDFSKTIEFSFMNTGVSEFVVITYTTEVTAEYSNYIQFGLIEHGQVVNSDG